MASSLLSDILQYADLARRVYRELNQMKAQGTGGQPKQPTYGSPYTPHEVAPVFPNEDRVFPLDSVVKEQYERIFGVDFSLVRIHMGPEATRLTRESGAQALAMGNDIYFATGHYEPQSEAGAQLLAHELQHVVQYQQRRAPVYLEDLAVLENEADMLESALQHIRVHGVPHPIVESDRSGRLNEEALEDAHAAAGAENPASGGGSNVGGMDSFRSRGTRKLIRVTLPSGRQVDMQPAQYQKMIDQVECGVREWVEEECESRRSWSREQFLMRYYSWAAGL